MAAFEDHLLRPRLRPSVAVELASSGATLRQRASSWEVAFDAEAGPAVRALLDRLGAGLASVEELAEHSGLDLNSTRAIVDELDRLGLLTEGEASMGAAAVGIGVVSGAQAARELRRFLGESTARVGRSRLYRALADGRATSAQLVGYALEYYHVVRAFPQIMGSVLARGDLGASRALVQDYFVSELGHDALLAQALRAVGVDPAVAERCLPLPSTFALVVSLSAYARQDWLTLRAALWLFEDPSTEYSDALASCARRCNLPDEFTAPLLAHARINDAERHACIPDRLLGAEDGVSAEMLATTKKRLFNLIETLVELEDEILEHYGQAGADGAPPLRMPAGMQS